MMYMYEYFMKRRGEKRRERRFLSGEKDRERGRNCDYKEMGLFVGSLYRYTWCVSCINKNGLACV